MPLPVALLLHPAGTYLFLIAALASLVYGTHSKRFVPLFAGSAASLLTLLAYLQVPPRPLPLLMLAAALLLLHVEFLLPTRGAAAVAGIALASYGSWLTLATHESSLAPFLRLTLALVGSATLLLAVARGLRRATSG